MTADLFSTSFIRIIVYLIIIDWVLGVGAALYKRQFRLYKVAYYLHDAVLPYVFVFAVVELVGRLQRGLEFIVPLTFFFVVASLVGNITGNLEKLGLSLPKWLRKE